MAYMVSKYGKNDDMYPKDLKKRAYVDHMLHFENGVLFQVIKDMVVSKIVHFYILALFLLRSECRRVFPKLFSGGYQLVTFIYEIN